MANEPRVVTPQQVNDSFKEITGEAPEEFGLKIRNTDEHIMTRRGHFNIILGSPGVGKTSWSIWYFFRLATDYKLRFMMYSGENDIREIFSQLVQLYTGKKYYEVSQGEVDLAADWIHRYFFFVDDTNIYTAEQLFELFDTDQVDMCVIDPHNSVKVPDGKNWYQYSVELGMMIRAFCKRTKKTVFLIGHPHTEAQRKKHTRGDFEGLPMPPIGPDMEGGGTWKNKADNLWVVHRYINHGYHWRFTRIAVEKVRYQETGVRPTPIEHPLMFKRNDQGEFYLTDMESYEEKTAQKADDIPF